MLPAMRASARSAPVCMLTLGHYRTTACGQGVLDPPRLSIPAPDLRVRSRRYGTCFCPTASPVHRLVRLPEQLVCVDFVPWEYRHAEAGDTHVISLTVTAEWRLRAGVRIGSRVILSRREPTNSSPPSRARVFREGPGHPGREGSAEDRRPRPCASLTALKPPRSR